jgi:hypothetical protein
VLGNISCGIRTVTIGSGLLSDLLRAHSFMFSNLNSSSVGTGELRAADMLGSEISGTQLCNYSLVGCDVAHVLS